MQKRRTVRKIIQEPNAIEYKTNIQRRNTKEDKRSPFVKPPSHYVPKNIELQNASQPLMTKIVYATVPKLYDGETIYIIGGGPSLKNFKFESLHGCRTIAINKAILFYPDADVFAMDTIISVVREYVGTPPYGRVLPSKKIKIFMWRK